MESALVQRSQILSLLPAPEDLLASCDSVFVIGKTWWDSWSRYAQGEQAPGPIDNQALYERYSRTEGMRGAALRIDLIKDIDYLYVTELIWTKLHGWYGGGPETELFIWQGVVDWAPVPLGVQTNLDTHYFLVSLCISLVKLKKFFCAKMQLPEGRYELTRGGKALEAASSLSNAGITAYVVFVLRERKIHLDLPAVYEDQGSDPMEAPVFDDLPSLIRTDRLDIQLRIQSIASQSKTHLHIHNINTTRHRLASLYDDHSVT